MTAWNPRANDLFLRALELRSPGERQAFLDDACAGDAAFHSIRLSALRCRRHSFGSGWCDSVSIAPSRTNSATLASFITSSLVECQVFSVPDPNACP